MNFCRVHPGNLRYAPGPGAIHNAPLRGETRQVEFKTGLPSTRSVGVLSLTAFALETVADYIVGFYMFINTYCFLIQFFLLLL